MNPWIASAKKLPPNGDLVFVCDYGATELAKAFHAAWYASGEWRSHAVWTKPGQFKPRYWMPIPQLPKENEETA